MVAASIEEMDAPRILIRATDGIGKSAFDASVRPCLSPPQSGATGRRSAHVSANIKEAR